MENIEGRLIWIIGSQIMLEIHIVGDVGLDSLCIISFLRSQGGIEI